MSSKCRFKALICGYLYNQIKLTNPPSTLDERRSCLFVRHLPREDMPPGCMRKRQARKSRVMPWAIYCQKTLGSGIYVDVALACISYLNFAKHQVHPVTVTVFTTFSSLFQQNNAPCLTAKIVQEWFEEHDKVLNFVFKFPRFEFE